MFYCQFSTADAKPETKRLQEIVQIFHRITEELERGKLNGEIRDDEGLHIGEWALSQEEELLSEEFLPFEGELDTDTEYETDYEAECFW